MPGSGSGRSAVRPRTTATGTPASLPFTRSAAAASSSTSAVLRDVELVAVGVDLAPVVEQGGQPGRADGDVGQPLAPGPAERVADDDADVHAEQLGQPGAEGAGRGVAVLGEEHQQVLGHVRGVDPGGGQDPALPRLHDRQRTAAGDDADRLLLDGVEAGGLPVGAGRDVHQPVLDLGDDLRGDDDDVAVGQPGRRGGDGAGEVVAGSELRQPGHRVDGQPVGRANHARRPGRRGRAPRWPPASSSSAAPAGRRRRGRRPGRPARRARRRAGRRPSGRRSAGRRPRR